MVATMPQRSTISPPGMRRTRSSMDVVTTKDGWIGNVVDECTTAPSDIKIPVAVRFYARTVIVLVSKGNRFPNDGQYRNLTGL